MTSRDDSRSAAPSTSWWLAAPVGAILALGIHTGPLGARRQSAATVEDVKAIVRSRYVRPVEDAELEYGAIRGLVASLDPYSAFFPPEEAAAFREDTDGALSGIGIEITLEKGYLTVIAPLEDTPAWHAGILPGDRIVQIDGKPRDITSIEEAARLIKGKAGTPVTLTIVHAGAARPEDVTIVRQKFNVPSVKRGRIVDVEAGLGLVRISQFGPRTAEELRAAVDALLAKGMRALVLDLRSNPGGHLDAAVGTADLFLESGVIVYTRTRDDEVSHTYAATAAGTFPGFPLAVLVNGSSASASEIVAGALKDAGRATIVGTRTFGKAAVQSLISLDADGTDDPALLKLTTARYFTRSGRQIQREPDAKDGDAWGIDPDVRVDLEWRKLQDIFRWRETPDAREAPADPQLEAAVAALKEKLAQTAK